MHSNEKLIYANNIVIGKILGGKYEYQIISKSLYT